MGTLNVYLSVIRSITLFSLFFIMLLTFFGAEQEVLACSCGRASTSMHVANADRVILARIGNQVKSGSQSVTSMEVLFTLKGEDSKTFSWVRADATPLCGPSYTQGDVQVVFIKAGRVNLCAGNFPMESQIRSFPSMLKTAHVKTQEVDKSTVGYILSKALSGYIHNRKQIQVHYSPLAGQRLSASKTTFRFVRSVGKRRPHKKAVIIDMAVQVNKGKTRIAMIRGRYPTEGLLFHVLVQEGPQGVETLYANVAEQ